MGAMTKEQATAEMERLTREIQDLAAEIANAGELDAEQLFLYVSNMHRLKDAFAAIVEQTKASGIEGITTNAGGGC